MKKSKPLQATKSERWLTDWPVSSSPFGPTRPSIVIPYASRPTALSVDTWDKDLRHRQSKSGNNNAASITTNVSLISTTLSWDDGSREDAAFRVSCTFAHHLVRDHAYLDWDRPPLAFRDDRSGTF